MIAREWLLWRLRVVTRVRVPIWPLMAFVLLCGFRFVAPAQQQPLPRKTRLDIVFSSSLFHSANRNDVIAAIRVWGRLIARKRGFQVEPAVTVTDDIADIRRHVQAGSAGILAVDVVEYFKLAELAAVEPVLSAMRGDGNTAPRYLLLVRGESGISSPEALRGKTVIVEARTNANLGRLWLDTMLGAGRAGRPEHFFGSLEAVPKATSAVLPLFFGKADAAVVDQAGFEVIREMNPQVGSKLRVLSASPELVEGIVCIDAKKVEYRDEVLESMRTLHLDPEGKQILTVFRFGRLTPVDKTALARVRELWQKHLLLSGPSEKVPPGTRSRPENQPARTGGL